MCSSMQTIIVDTTCSSTYVCLCKDNRLECMELEARCHRSSLLLSSVLLIEGGSYSCALNALVLHMSLGEPCAETATVRLPCVKMNSHYS